MTATVVMTRAVQKKKKSFPDVSFWSCCPTMTIVQLNDCHSRNNARSIFKKQKHLLKCHLWNLGPGYHAGRLEELLILNRPCRPGEDLNDSVLPISHWMRSPWMWHTKKPENTITLKKAELRKDEEEMAHYHKHQWQAFEGTRLKVWRVLWSYLSEEKYWEPGWHHWELVSLFHLKGNTWAVFSFCGLFVGAVFLAFSCH